MQSDKFSQKQFIAMVERMRSMVIAPFRYHGKDWYVVRAKKKPQIKGLVPAPESLKRKLGMRRVWIYAV